MEPIWINVVPQLLTGLCRPEASMIMTQLKVIAEKYPQALLQSPFAALEEYHKENVKVSENIAKVKKEIKQLLSYYYYFLIQLTYFSLLLSASFNRYTNFFTRRTG